MSSRPSLKYNSINNRWEIRGKGGDLKASFGDNSETELVKLQVGATGDTFSKVYGFVATMAAALDVGSGALGIATLQSLTGSGVGCAELAIGDFIMGVPKTALDSVVVTGFHIPTTNTLNAYVHTLGEDAGGSLAVIGFDIVSLRKS